MYFIKAEREHAKAITMLVKETIAAVYPKYYPKEVVDFFLSLHSEEKIKEDVEQGKVSILFDEGQLIGTGSQEAEHITRLYVAPQHQKKGYGTYIMEQLETAVFARYKKILVEASLPACQLYEKLGYKTIYHDQWQVENNAVLVYEVMEKQLCEKKEQKNCGRGSMKIDAD